MESLIKMDCREITYGSAEYVQTIALRKKILREPLGLEFTEDELLAERWSFHLTCWSGDALLACVMLSPSQGKKIRMRQLAVSEKWQRQGIGRTLVKYLEIFTHELGCHEIVLHARESAVLFYEKLGYSKEGDRFFEVTLPHFSMQKHLS
ncbi:GNAT family N-acetyltransferase [Pontiellaceae bacterium B1224]|nr:GNAT family N-acetyltransferase [Pontiellaceae bacterium B1224]